MLLLLLNLHLSPWQSSPKPTHPTLQQNRYNKPLYPKVVTDAWQWHLITIWITIECTHENFLKHFICHSQLLLQSSTTNNYITLQYIDMFHILQSPHPIWFTWSWLTKWYVAALYIPFHQPFLDVPLLSLVMSSTFYSPSAAFPV